MTLNEKILDIARTLLDRTTRNEVVWEVKGLSPGRQVFSVRFPASEVRVYLSSSEDAPDRIGVNLFNAKAEHIGGLEVSETSQDWPKFFELWSEASRSATGWDKVVADIDRALKQPGRIGTQPQEATK